MWSLLADVIIYPVVSVSAYVGAQQFVQPIFPTNIAAES
jgi:hypothetical protein